MSTSLSFLLIVTMTISFCMCCPIGCTELPTLRSYLTTAEDQHAPLQVRVNVSTTSGTVFQPQLIQQVLTHRNGILPQPNGCSGFFNFTSRQTGVDTVCPWRYTCDFDPQRIPAFMFHATCDSASPRGNMWRGLCDEVYAPVSYLRTESCYPLAAAQDRAWSVITSLVPVACNLIRQDQ